ncbi:hypothetical protein GIB67_013170 [Kingdonia uniflora]|uniref:KIB1-4 beta-propeller domain-containing protein n=1 Tax=Kingdonia uniflora TaxID=39325 RepID=A0A7J7LCJ0_9MAGN|nr:hypothetical protein GIB67_013170 [Kingdonia uniflora]
MENPESHTMVLVRASPTEWYAVPVYHTGIPELHTVLVQQQITFFLYWELNGSAPRQYAHTIRQIQVSHTLEGYGGEYAEHHTVLDGFFAKSVSHGDHYPGVRELPWLMLSDSKIKNVELRKFYSLSTNKFFDIHLPEFRGGHCFASPFVWLITISPDRRVNLLHSLTLVQVQLPMNPVMQDIQRRYRRNEDMDSIMPLPFEDLYEVKSLYIVEIAEELHIVPRMSNFDTKMWEKLCSLDDYVLFVGASSSFSLSALKYPELRGNCIYFAHDGNEVNCSRSESDMGIFDIKEGTIQPIHSGLGTFHPFIAPDWLAPSLWQYR